jgi:hypothetical protein
MCPMLCVLSTLSYTEDITDLFKTRGKLVKFAFFSPKSGKMLRETLLKLTIKVLDTD